MRSLRATSIASVFLFALVAADVVYGIASDRQETLSWRNLSLAALGVFVLLSDTVTKLVLSPTGGITIEKKIKVLKDDAKRLAAVTQRVKADALSTLLRSSTTFQHNVWGELITYRMVMRLLLRRLCEQVDNAAGLSDTPSLSGMLRRLRTANVLDNDSCEKLERIRNVTFVAEWGTGHLPPDNDIKWVLQHGESALLDLQALLRP